MLIIPTLRKKKIIGKSAGEHVPRFERDPHEVKDLR